MGSCWLAPCIICRVLRPLFLCFEAIIALADLPNTSPLPRTGILRVLPLGGALCACLVFFFSLALLGSGLVSVYHVRFTSTFCVCCMCDCVFFVKMLVCFVLLVWSLIFLSFLRGLWSLCCFVFFFSLCEVRGKAPEGKVAAEPRMMPCDNQY
ncbi:hypothetical protein BDY21DRAFT_155803 [Lineolata rhizophorae]|uniref:Uncharacterized protein n=1 Tax=Lineolata rhizophorae TaxID=578093 RepID=A0A6A6NMP4_9PEZI|nr:hypothetical protein BDY21DRAFT_155803 [Lineolata rhizophorae]